MTFNSLEYAAFFPVVFLVYWRLRRRAQNVLLLVASYVFYGLFDWRFLGLLALSTGLDFWFGRSLDRTEDDGRRRRWLIASLAVNLGILGVFKYYDFFADSAAGFLDRVGLSVNPPLLRVLLPVGISFYTFHGISYVFDVYRRHIPATRRLLDYAVFVAFFPQLVAGPIGRAHLQLPQFEHPRRYPRGDEFTGGLVLIITGLFKKVVIADGVAGFVNESFNQAGTATGVTLFFAAWAFSLQIYGDFSGYSDIARGSAQLLGVVLPVNFREPYLSRSITEFWRRWHVSLSNWLRDYVYIPFGGNRGSRFATYRNLMATMLIGGLWHGASWTFVAWGGLHGLLLCVDRLLGRDRLDAERPIVWRRDAVAILVTANLACLAFVLFRSASFGQALDVIGGVATLRGGLHGDGAGIFLATAAAIAVFVLDASQRRRPGTIAPLQWGPVTQGLALGIAAVLLVVFSGGAPVPFIYFQF